MTAAFIIGIGIGSVIGAFCGVFYGIWNERQHLAEELEEHLEATDPTAEAFFADAIAAHKDAMERLP